MERRLSRNSLMTAEFDWFLFILTVIVSIFGIFMVYSTTRSYGTNTNVIIQSCAWVIGFVGMFIFCLFDYEQFGNMIRYIAYVSIALLVSVFIWGVTGDWGARSWIRIGSVGLQPSEFVKIGFAITFSYHLSKVGDKLNKFSNIFWLVVHIAVPVFLILMQPDAGSAMVFMFMFLCMMFAAKLSFKYIIPVACAGLAAIPVVYNFVLSDYQQKRILVFLNPELDPVNSGYNVLQSKIAVGSGGLTGQGFTEGTQNMMGYLPAKHTDFIFSVVGEEFGFIGCILLISVLFLIIARCFSVAAKADNLFGRYICTGVGAMFLFHTFENVGMCIGIMPVTGIPLPFISYGGTSLVTSMAAVGLVMSVAYHNKPRSIYEVY